MADYSSQYLVAEAQYDSSGATADAIPAASLMDIGTVDKISPTVDNFSPANGSTIEGTDPIRFDVKDNLALLSGIFVYVDPGDGQPEAVYDLAAGAFLGTYANLSTTTSIDGGLSFSVRRFSGWVGNVTVTIRVVDSAGNTN